MARNSGWQRQVSDYRPAKSTLFWSCAACVVATIVVGFVWGGWVTGGTANKMAGEGRMELAAQFCAANFAAGTGATGQLATLKAANAWERGDLISKGGWDAAPGSKEPMNGVAELCAKRLLAGT